MEVKSLKSLKSLKSQGPGLKTFQTFQIFQTPRGGFEKFEKFEKSAGLEVPPRGAAAGTADPDLAMGKCRPEQICFISN